jgi:hypothetical protein
MIYLIFFNFPSLTLTIPIFYIFSLLLYANMLITSKTDIKLLPKCFFNVYVSFICTTSLLYSYYLGFMLYLY